MKTLAKFLTEAMTEREEFDSALQKAQSIVCDAFAESTRNVVDIAFNKVVGKLSRQTDYVNTEDFERDVRREIMNALKKDATDSSLYDHAFKQFQKMVDV